MLTSHSIELPTSRLFIILNIRLVDKSLYWTPNLSTSHCIELPNCRPVTLYTCRPLDQWLQWISTYRPVTIDLSICQAVGPTIIWQNMLTSPTSRFTDSLTVGSSDYLTMTCQQVNPMTHPSWISNSIVDHSSYMYLHY